MFHGEEGGIPIDRETAADARLTRQFFTAEADALTDGRRWAACATVADPAVISVGVAVPVYPPYATRAHAEGVPIIRRHSGGTAVLHLQGDLLWSMVLPRDDRRVGRNFTRQYDRFGDPVTRCVSDVAGSAAWVDPPGVSRDYCTLGDRGKVLSVNGRIVGGAAQHATHRALLHHGTVSVRLDRRLLERIFGAETVPPESRLGSLRDLGVTTDARALAGRLRDRLVEFVDSPPPG